MFMSEKSFDAAGQRQDLRSPGLGCCHIAFHLTHLMPSSFGRVPDWNLRNLCDYPEENRCWLRFSILSVMGAY